MYSKDFSVYNATNVKGLPSVIYKFFETRHNSFALSNNGCDDLVKGS